MKDRADPGMYHSFEECYLKLHLTNKLGKPNWGLLCKWEFNAVKL